MGIWDSIKYDFIGFLTPEQREYNNRIYAKKNAEEEYWRTRKQAVLRVWYIKELEKYDFFVDSKKYTNKQWQEKDFFDFKKYRWSLGRELFYETVYQVMYSELLNKLGKEKLELLRINGEIKKIYKDKMFSDIYWEFNLGWSIEDLVGYFSKFSSYKEYKKKRILYLKGNKYSIEDLEKIMGAAKKGSKLTWEEKEKMFQAFDDLYNEYHQHPEIFEQEFLEPLYKEYDKQMKLAKQLAKSPLAKEIHEQNKLLKKQMGIEEEESIFSFSDKMQE